MKTLLLMLGLLLLLLLRPAAGHGVHHHHYLEHCCPLHASQLLPLRVVRTPAVAQQHRRVSAVSSE